MFDYVNFSMACPNCGEKIDGFQSKDASCDMVTIEPDSISEFYSPCDKCGAWVAFYRPLPDPPPPRKKQLTLEEVKSLGFEMKVTPRAADPADGG